MHAYVLVALLLAAPPEAEKKREAYVRSLSACKHGSSGIIIEVETEEDGRRRLDDTLTPAERYAQKLLAGAQSTAGQPRQRTSSSHREAPIDDDPPPIVEGTLETLPLVKAVVSKRTLEAVLSDAEVRRVHADCIVRLEPPVEEEELPFEGGEGKGGEGARGRRLAVQSSPPWGLDRIDAASGLDGSYDCTRCRSRTRARFAPNCATNPRLSEGPTFGSRPTQTGTPPAST